MEHLPIPRDPIEGHPIIRLATKRFRDPGPFLTYPEKFGDVFKGSYPHVPSQADALAGIVAAAVSSYDILDYYQGWLFFALLQEFLGNVYDMNNYIEPVYNADGSIEMAKLSTKTLHDDIEAWRVKGPLADIQPGDEYHNHLRECLNAVSEAFRKIEMNYTGFSNVFSDDMLCFVSLAEVLDSAVTTALDDGPLPNTSKYCEFMPHYIINQLIFLTDHGSLPAWRGYPSPALQIGGWMSKIQDILTLSEGEINERMIQAGWCHGDISRVQDSFFSVSAYYYFSKFKPEPNAPHKHKDCKPYGCTLVLPTEPKHMRPDCNCSGMISFPEEDLISIYEKGCLPCFSIGKLEDGSLGVALSQISLDEESQRDPSNYYIALSHVWSEGMGNPQANALTLCQLGYAQYMSMLAYQVVEEKLERDPSLTGTVITVQHEPKTRKVKLWIDTMCCPATSERGKNLCLAMMREIYSNAYAVLVKSTAFEDLSLGDLMKEKERGIVDLGAKIYLSPWMRRMWTLQEGVLAGALKGRGAGDRLCFALADGLLTLESLVNLFKKAPKHESLFAFDFIGKFGHLSPAIWRLDQDHDSSHSHSPDFYFLEILSTSLKYRSVSVTSDEAICLATLLGLRISTTHGAVSLIGDVNTPDQGMCEFWRLVEAQKNGLPCNLVFSSVPRLRVPGFGWAPRTFIGNAKYGRLYTSSGSSGNLAKIMENGLLARYRGAQLKPMAPHNAYGKRLLRKSHESSESKLGDNGGPRRRMLLRIPANGDTWYAVGVSSIDGYEGDELHTVHDTQLDPFEHVASGSSALIFKSPEDWVHEVGSTSMTVMEQDISTVGILTTITTQPPSSPHEPQRNDTETPIQVHTEFPVIIHALPRSGVIISAAGHRTLELLSKAVEVEASQRGGASVDEVWRDDDLVEQLLAKTAIRVLAADEGLMDALYREELSRKTSTSQEKLLNYFINTIDRLAYIGGVGGEWFPENQLWCVD
jgi:hypothetical protein